MIGEPTSQNSKPKRVSITYPRKLLDDFFRTERLHRQKEEALNRAKAEISETLAVHQKLETNLQNFTRPKNQLNIEDNGIERSREAKEKLLGEAQDNFLKSADTASNAKRLGTEILQRIDDYRQAKSEASSSIHQMRDEWQTLKNHEGAKYIWSELQELRNQVNLAEQHFEADTASDYHKSLEISREISSRIGELTPLADKRKLEHKRKIKRAIIGGLIGSIPGDFWLLGMLAGDSTMWPFVFGGWFWGVVGALIGYHTGKDKNDNS